MNFMSVEILKRIIISLVTLDRSCHVTTPFLLTSLCASTSSMRCSCSLNFLESRDVNVFFKFERWEDSV